MWGISLDNVAVLIGDLKEPANLDIRPGHSEHIRGDFRKNHRDGRFTSLT